MNETERRYMIDVMDVDALEMDIYDYMQKYIDIMEDPKTTEIRKETIKAIIYPMYKEATGRNYDVNYFKAYE